MLVEGEVSSTGWLPLRQFCKKAGSAGEGISVKYPQGEAFSADKDSGTRGRLSETQYCEREGTQVASSLLCVGSGYRTD